MAGVSDILALLTGRKVFDGRQWRVYDPDGNELADPGGVLWKGVHGALLWNANRYPSPTPTPPQFLGIGGGGFAPARPPRYLHPTTYDVPIRDHHPDDEEEIIMAILCEVARIEYFQ